MKYLNSGIAGVFRWPSLICGCAHFKVNQPTKPPAGVAYGFTTDTPPLT